MTTTADLRPCNVSLVRVPVGRHGAAVVVEKHVAPFIREFDRRYLADPRSHGYPIRKADTGAYNCRKTTSGSSWSKHAYGCAIDFNWSTNGYGASSHDIPGWFVDILISLGFGWGGSWRRVKDWMHFSKFVNEGGDGKLDWSAPEPKPEEALMVTPDDEKRIRAIVKDELKNAEILRVAVKVGGKDTKLGIDHFIKALAEKAGVIDAGGNWKG